MKISRCRN